MFQQKMYDLYRKMDDAKLLKCIRSSLVMLIPILLIGSFATVLTYFPIPAYQEFITTFCGGIIATFFQGVYAVTGGMVAVYMTISLAISYSNQQGTTWKNGYGGVFTALICFVIFTGVANAEEFQLVVFGTTGMFSAVVCGLGSSFLYDKISRRFHRKAYSYAEGADETFLATLSTLAPMVIVVLIFAALDVIMIELFHVTSILELFTRFGHAIFAHAGRSLGTAILYEVMLNVMWFFGVHGGDALEYVTENVFNKAVQINIDQVAQGLEATDIFNGSFLNVFVAMGGCGTVICLLIAMLIFGKRKSNRQLARWAIVPGLFNISEILVFGLPVVFNPIFFVPFILTPVVMVITSAFAMSVGLVPVPSNVVQWTTPVILGGYLATDSIAGAILQIVNLALGVLIYAPFVKMFDDANERNAISRMNALIGKLQQAENEKKPIELLELRDNSGSLARMLAEELEMEMKEKLPTMYYQPQFDKDGKCIGLESLLRWIHPSYGIIYPPLVIKLAEESGNLLNLEKSIFASVFNEIDHLMEMLEPDAKVSVNVTGTTIQREEFIKFLKEMSKKYEKYMKNIVIEITEQAALQIDDSLIEKLTRIHEMGYGLAIDDFSMGQTSIKYLQINLFSLIKLDGAISKSVLDNQRSYEIVSSITKLAKDLDIQVLAEFVETEEQRKILENADCHWYQGALYSLAVSIDDLEGKLRQQAIQK